MDFRKLPSNSEGLLLKLVCSENPTQVLRKQYNGLSTQQEQELDGIIRELKELGYIDVKWADNEPYFVILNNSARTYSERLAEYNTHNPTNATQGKKEKNTIFISHRSTDKGIADMLVDFFAGTGISKEAVFCSSLPGNMYGFLNNEYKLRRLDSDTDISYIYDTVSEAVSAPHTKASLITYENNKLRTRYAEYLKVRELPPGGSDISIADTIAEITTDDERIVLYYILHENVRKVSKSTISSWLNKCEIRGVNVDNAFDLLSSFDNGALNNDTLEFGIDTFRKYSANVARVLPPLKKCVDQHIELAVNIFKKIWSDDTLDINIRLFVAYIVEERMRTFGDRWMAEGEIENIRQWESKNTLDSTLSNNYGSCLEFFVQNELVYASSWTSYGNPREYTLFPSLQELLFNCPHKIMEELQKVKDAYHLDFPF